jgi:NAD(P)H-hydrate repair Nnr-like enzyme with NAD(P)H-hydrate dehydratase domain
VKGGVDLVAGQKGVEASINSYAEEAMEAIGGTGDTLTGMVSVLIDTGMDVLKAATIAAQANRLAGHYAAPTPATQVVEIIRHIPRALEKLL